MSPKLDFEPSLESAGCSERSVRPLAEPAERSCPGHGRTVPAPVTSLAVGNPWLGWELTRDPFFREALTPEADSPRPAERLHVGREPEPVPAANQVLGATSPPAVVRGEYGVGETSFTSRLKTVLADHGVLTHARPVRITRDLRAREFEAEVLRALLHIRASLPDEQRPRESAEDAAFWRRPRARSRARTPRAAAKPPVSGTPR